MERPLTFLLAIILLFLIATKAFLSLAENQHLYFFSNVFWGLVFTLGLLSITGVKEKLSKLLAHKWNRHFLIFQFLFWTIYLTILYPGFFYYDSYVSLENTLNTRTTQWQGHFYGFICYSLSFFNSHLFAVPVFNILLWLGSLFTVINFFPIQNLKYFLLLTGVSLLPLQLMTLPLVVRGTMFGTLSCLLVAQLLPYICNTNRRISKSSYLLFLISLFITSEIRHDGIIYLFTLPILFYTTQNQSLQKKWLFNIAFCFLMICLNLFLQSKESASADQSYQFSAIIHPLNAIFYSPDSNISESDERIVSKVINPLHLKKHYDPHTIAQFHNHLYTLPISSADWKEFQWTYLHLVFKNWRIFLNERIEVAGHTFGFSPSAFIFADQTAEPPLIFLKSIPSKDLPTTLEKLSQLRNFVIRFFYSALSVSHSISTIAVTLLNPLFFLLVAGFLSLKTKMTLRIFNTAVILLAARSLVVFFTAPEAHINYYAPMIYLPILCISASLLSSQKQLTT